MGGIPLGDLPDFNVFLFPLFFPLAFNLSGLMETQSFLLLFQNEVVQFQIVENRVLIHFLDCQSPTHVHLANFF